MPLTDLRNDDDINAQALSLYTVRLCGFIPVYRFVREDEEQEFQIYRDPFADEALMCFGIGDLDEIAMHAVAGYAEQALDMHEHDGSDDE